MSTAQHPAVQTILAQTEEKMKKSLERMKQEFGGIRSGRASAALLDSVRVDYYGSMVPLQQVAAVGVPDGRTIEVKPWDAGSLQAIEKGIQASGLGLNPNNDGKIIRISIPMLTEERRKDLVKVLKKMAEEFRVSVRNDRREAMEKIKTAAKDKVVTEDERKSAETASQHLTDLYVKKVDDAAAAKEKEILEV
jgi:ribosome recycling factor